MSAIPEGFEGRADSAAERLKATMGLPSQKVDAAETGAQNAPPQGSYIAQQRAAQKEELARRRAEEVQDPGAPPPLPDEHVAEAYEQQIAPHPAPQAEENGQEVQASPRAQERIRELAGQRRDLERRAGELESNLSRSATENEELRQINHALAQQIQQLQEANLDNLPEDERARVIANIEARQAANLIKEEVMSEVSPVLGEVREHRFNLAMVGLSKKYPGFDAEVHPGRIQTALEENPNLTPEQAFRIVASDDELLLAGRPRQPRVPTVIPPRGTQSQRNLAPPAAASQETNQHDQLVDERNEWAKTARSNDPVDKRTADRMLHNHLLRRLGG